MNQESGSTVKAANSARVRIVIGPLVGPVLGRVVAMLAARADCPVDRLDDALLVVDALAANAGAYVPDGRLSVDVLTGEGCLELLVGPLADGGADGLMRDSTVPGVGNVLEHVADQVGVQRDSETGAPVLCIRIEFPA